MNPDRPEPAPRSPSSPDALPADALPADALPGDALPAAALPGESAPASGRDRPQPAHMPGTEGAVLCGPGCECDEQGQVVRPAPRARMRIEGLRCRYGDTTAFRDVDLALPEGTITALIGPSGCGKSSLLACLDRLTELIPGCRVDGRVWLDDHLVVGDGPLLDAITLRRRVGMIFQKPNPFPLTIRRNLELPLREHGVRRRHERAEIAESALRDVGLWDEVKDRLDTPALALSGGQQQRLCLARALALEPEIVLLDEPCSALDPISSGVVEDLIASLRGRYTVLIVTHNLAQARRIADRTAFFWLVDGVGRLVEQGPTRQIFESPRDPLTRAYVEGIRG